MEKNLFYLDTSKMVHIGRDDHSDEKVLAMWYKTLNQIIPKRKSCMNHAKKLISG